MEEEHKDGLCIIMHTDGKREVLLKDLIEHLPSVKEYREQKKEKESIVLYALVVDRKERHVLEEFLEFVSGSFFEAYLSIDLAFPDISEALDFISKRFIDSNDSRKNHVVR